MKKSKFFGNFPGKWKFLRPGSTTTQISNQIDAAEHRVDGLDWGEFHWVVAYFYASLGHFTPETPYKYADARTRQEKQLRGFDVGGDDFIKFGSIFCIVRLV